MNKINELVENGGQIVAHTEIKLSTQYDDNRCGSIRFANGTQLIWFSGSVTTNTENTFTFDLPIYVIRSISHVCDDGNIHDTPQFSVSSFNIGGNGITYYVGSSLRKHVWITICVTGIWKNL